MHFTLSFFLAQLYVSLYVNCNLNDFWYIQDYFIISILITEIKTWLNINHITVHNNTYCIF